MKINFSLSKTFVRVLIMSALHCHILSLKSFKDHILRFSILLYSILLLGFTPLVNAQCLHTLSLTDTYGDGWNGGAVTVTVNGTPVYTNVTLTSGYGPATGTFTAATGDVINVTRTIDGSWPSEMRIEVYYGANTVIALQQPPTSPGVNGTGNCGGGGSPPTNDDCGDAITLTVGAAATNGTVEDATQTIAASGSCPTDGSSPMDVWYEFTTSVAGVHTITLVPSANFDGIVEYRTGTSCNGTYADCQDGTGGAGETEVLTPNLASGTKYFIRVYQYSAPSSYTFTIRVTGPAASPTLTANPTSLSGFDYVVGSGPSSSQTYTISGNDLSGSGNITVTAPTNYQVSKDDITYSNSITFAYSGGTITGQPKTVYVRLKSGLAVNSYNGNVTNAGGGATTKNVACTGSVTAAAGYCTASGTTCDEYISNVAVGSINKSSACTNYADYTALSTNMSIGTGYPITVTNGSGYSGDQCGIWVDWNQDQDFGDANETIATSGGPSSFTATITPPAGATAGATRMRVRIMYTGTLSSCGATTYGEVEDYTVNVVAGCTPPTTNAAAPTYTNNTTGTSITVSWTGGNGNGSLVVARLTATANVEPTSGSTYTADAAFGSGGTTGTDNYVVYKGTAATVNVTGLTCGTDYTFLVYEYNTTGTCYKTPGSSSAVTTYACPCTQPTTQATINAYTNNTTGTSITVNWTNGNGTAGRIVVARLTATANAEPTEGTSYTADPAFGSGTQIGTANYVVYKGTAATVNVTGLTCNTDYTFLVYEYNTTGICYKTPGSSSAVITYVCPPANDDCPGVELTVDAAAIGGTVAAATQTTTSTCAATPDEDVWYNFTTASAGNYVITVVGDASFDAVIELRSGACDGANVACEDASGNGGTEIENDYSCAATTTYLIRVWDYGTGEPATPTFTIKVESPGACTPPASQATIGSYSNNTTGTSITVNWSRSWSGDKVLVVARLTATTDVDPTIGTSYTANTTFNLGVPTGTGNYVVYNNTGSSVTVTGLTQNTDYTFTVYEYNTTGNCYLIPSSSSSVTTACPTPATPSISSATNKTCNSFDANWSTVAGATKYYLDVSTSSGFGTFVTGYENLDVGLVLTYPVNTGLSPSTTYYYRVRSYNACGSSSNSGWTSLTTSSVATPTSNAESNITCTSFSANWTAYTGATTYYLDVSTEWDFSSYVTGYQDKDVGLVLTSSVTGLNSSGTYYYQVRALSSCGTSPSSSYQTVYTSAGLSAPSTNAATNKTCNSFDANWSTVAGAIKYYLDVSTVWDFASFVTGYDDRDVGNVLTYSVTGLNSGTDYYYRVRAYNTSCNSSPSSSYTYASTVSPPSVPDVYEETDPTCDGFTANWSWESCDGYYLYVYTDPTCATLESGYPKYISGSSNYKYNVTGLSPSTDYGYKVSSDNGCESALSSAITATTTPSGGSCNCPQVIGALPFTQPGKTTCGFGDTFDNMDACGSYYMDGEDYVYKYVPSTDQTISVTLSNTSTYTGVFITNGCPTSGTCVAYNESSAGNPSICSASLTNGQTYYIIISTNSTSCTNFDISVTASAASPPANDECAGAINLTVGSTCSYNQYTNACATGSAVSAPPCGNYAGGDVWFRAIMPASGNMNITTLPGDMTDGAMSVYKGNSCNGLIYIDCNDDYCGIIGGLMPEIRIRDISLAGKKIWIRIWSENNGNTGTFEICAFEPVAPTPCSGNPVATDNCAGATPVCEASAYCGSTSDYYSKDLPGNMCDGCGLFDGSIENNSWLSFQANATTASLHVVVSNCSNGIQMGIYTGTACGAFSLVSDIDYTSVWGGQFDFIIDANFLTPGNDYYIMIDGYAGAECDYSITPESGVSVVEAGPNQCSIGPVQLQATGGSGYTWTPTTGLSDPNIANPIANPGATTTYTVTADGANPLCPAISDEVTVYEYDVTIDNSDVTVISCYDGSNGEATPVASGGGGPYSYLWNTTPVQTTQNATGLTAGTYTVTVTNQVSGCIQTADVIVSQAPKITITESASAANCDQGTDGTVTVASVTNGTGPYTYSWNTTPVQTTQTATGLQPGTYYVTITDATGCVAEITEVPVVVSTSYETSNTNYTWIGITSTNWNTSSNWCRQGTDVPNSVTQDVTIPAATSFDCYIPDDGISYKVKNITIDGTLKEGGTNSKLEVAGDWINNGTFVENSGTITFNGSSTQNVESNNNSFGNVEILNTVTPSATDGIVLTNNMPITSTLTLTEGTIITGGNMVIISNSSGNKVVDGTNNTNYTLSWVFGTLTRNLTTNTDVYNFPVGSATSGYLAKLTNNSMTGTTQITASFESGAPSNPDLGLASLSDLGTSYTTLNTGGTWELTPNSQPAGVTTYDLQLYFNDFTGLDNNKFGVVSRADHTVPWTLIGNVEANTFAQGYAKRTSCGSFSKKGIAKTSSPLPIELLSFTAQCVDNTVLVNWSTASETNNDYFTVQKALTFPKFETLEKLEWENVTYVQGAGNSNQTIHYSIVDPDPYYGVSYYRLKQTDYDENYSYSNIVAVNCSEIIDYNNTLIYNSPETDNIIISFKDNINESYFLYFIDQIGRILIKKQMTISQPDEKILINKSGFASGIYNVILQSENNIVNQSVIINQ
ncbi:MAG: GEVED domain-containing protein [Bacteroidota bacterium]